MADIYRDPLLGLRDRLGALRATVAALAGKLSEQLWRHLPGDEARELAEMSTDAASADAIASADGATGQQLATAIEALERYRAALASVVERLPEIEAASIRPPDRAPELRFAGCGWLTGDTDAEAFTGHRERLVQLIRERDPEATFDEEMWIRGVGGVIARYRDGGVPLALRYQYEVVGTESTSYATSITLATTVAPATPQLALRPELTRHTFLLKPLGLIRDAEVGSLQFDGLFIIDADEEAAVTLLSKEVQRGLIEVARFDIPTVTVGDGEAAIRWRYEPKVTAIDGARRALAGIRDAPLSVALTEAARER